MKTVKLTVCRSGFTIRTRTIEMSPDRFRGFLTPRVQRTITKAARSGHKILITKDTAVCPYCGKEVPAYPVPPAGKGSFRERTPEIIEAWLSGQLSFSGDQPEELSFNTPSIPFEHLICPKCGRRSAKGGEQEQIVLREKRKKIMVAMKLGVTDLITLPWAEDMIVEDTVVIESITFNQRNGQSFLELRNERGKRLATLDVTERNLREMKKDPVIRMIEAVKPVCRELKRMFQEQWNGMLPFSSREMNIERYILLNRFVGFDRSFYRAIPCVDEENIVEKGFARIAKRIRYIQNVPRVFEESRLPNVKSIRRIVFSEPSLLFYKDELVTFWELFSDVNLFRRFLENREMSAYWRLAFLHSYPGTAVFFREYGKIMHEDGLLRLLEADIDNWWDYALAYASMSGFQRKREQGGWIRTNQIGTVKKSPLLSVPLCASEADGREMPEDCSIDGYVFTRLRTTLDYFHAGKDLQNCLTERGEGFRTGIYGIVKDGTFVAAVELYGKEIVEHAGFRNKEIERCSGLFAAFWKWAEKNGFQN